MRPRVGRVLGPGQLCATTWMTVAVGLGGACSEGPAGTAPVPEVAESQPDKLDLPPPPEFVEPQPNPDGSHSVTEMRLRGSRYLDQQVRVTGTVTFVYDLRSCASELGQKRVAEKASLCDKAKDWHACVQGVGEKAVAESPDLCERPYFYLGETAEASVERALWVVDVTRPLRADEKRDRAVVEAWKQKPPPPELTVGQRVTVTGTWAIKSPDGFANSDGLLVYGGVVAAQ